MADLNDLQVSGATRVVGSDANGAETYPLAVDSSQQALVKDAGAQVALASILSNQTNGAQVVQAISEQKATYSAAISQLQIASNATDFLTIRGSATKKVRITKLQISAIKEVAGYLTVELIRRSATNTSGTSTTLTAITHDEQDAASGAEIRAYTANPTLGASVGLMHSSYVFMPFQGSLLPHSPLNLVPEFGKPIILDGTSDVLAVALKIVDDVDDATGLVANISVTWSEE